MILVAVVWDMHLSCRAWFRTHHCGTLGIFRMQLWYFIWLLPTEPIGCTPSRKVPKVEEATTVPEQLLSGMIL